MDSKVDRITLQQIARKAMIASGLEPGFPTSVPEDVKEIASPQLINQCWTEICTI
jgi:hypothetical protein